MGFVKDERISEMVTGGVREKIRHFGGKILIMLMMDGKEKKYQELMKILMMKK